MSITLEIIDYWSGDIPEVWNWKPESAQDVFFQLGFEVGEVGRNGGNDFQVVVATREGIEKFNTKYPDGDLPSKGLMVVENYSWQAFCEQLYSEVQKCALNSWEESIQCLSKKFLWEYDDYVFDAD